MPPIYGKLFVLIGAFLALVSTPTPHAAQPNFIFLLADDYRADCVHALGNRSIHTPNIDRIVRAGASFTQAHILGAQQGAVCVPSRAMMLSGRSLFRVPDNLKDVETWPEKLSSAGYATFMAGKWHNGRESLQRIFPSGENVFLGGMSDQFAIKVSDVNNGHISNERVGKTFSAELFTDSAIKFLRQRTNSNPFCLYVAFTTPHDPRAAPITFRAKYRAKEMKAPPNFLAEHPFDNGEMNVRDEKLLPHPRTVEAIQNEIADYYATITATDAQIGRILDELKRLKLEKETVIIFAGDNGLALGSHGLLGKQNLYEHSMRVPLVMAGPGIPRGKRTATLVALSDLAATICDLANTPTPAASEGHSFAPVFRGQYSGRRKVLFTAYRDVQRAITDGRWKLIVYPKTGLTQLFDLLADPHEMNDLSESLNHAQTRSRLQVLLEKEKKAAGDPLLQL